MKKKCPVSGAFEPSAMREKVYGWNKKEVIFMLRSVLPIHDVFRADDASSIFHLPVTHPQVSSMYSFITDLFPFTLIMAIICIFL